MPNISQTSMPPFIIAQGDANSNALNFSEIMFDAEAISIQAPSVVEAAEYNLQASDDGVTWGDLQDINRVAIKVPKDALATIVYNGIIVAVNWVRIHCASNAAAPRTFLVKKVWRGF